MLSSKPVFVALSHSLDEDFCRCVETLDPRIQLIKLDSTGAPQGPEPARLDVLLVSYDYSLGGLLDEQIADNILALAQRAAFVQTGVAGLDEPFLARIYEASKRYVNGSGIHAVSIGQYVTMQMLRVVKELDRHSAQQRAKSWERIFCDGELTDKRLLIYGYGGIGQEIARMARCMGMYVVGLKREPASDQWADEVLAADTWQTQVP
ncbi:MAG: NAD(P)-dependent oxidoreductase, partial [Gammaproteobacteria bacterium]